MYPFKTVEAGAVVNSSIIWESRGALGASSDGTASAGLANVDITPELAVKLALAYGDDLARRGRRSSPPATRAGRRGC